MAFKWKNRRRTKKNCKAVKLAFGAGVSTHFNVSTYVQCVNEIYNYIDFQTFLFKFIVWRFYMSWCTKTLGNVDVSLIKTFLKNV